MITFRNIGCLPDFLELTNSVVKSGLVSRLVINLAQDNKVAYRDLVILLL